MEGQRVGTLKKYRHQDDTHMAVNEKGFTLVELMIALVLFLIVVAGIYSTFTFQQEAYMQTESKVNMVQEARAAQFFLARDLKMAGYDPSTYAHTGFDQADIAEANFSMDIAANGDPDNVEITRFALTSENGDIIDDGLCPTGTTCRLSREWCSDKDNCGGMQPVAENVEAFELCYIIGNMYATTAPNNLELSQITSVIVSLLMRQSYNSKKYRNTNTYLSASGNAEFTPDFTGDRSEGWGPFNDSWRRKLVIFEVKARNIGMNPYLDF
jgi:type IV pilus assembly protein PilW